jgi:hypothetical protein
VAKTKKNKKKSRNIPKSGFSKTKSPEIVFENIPKYPEIASENPEKIPKLYPGNSRNFVIS